MRKPLVAGNWKMNGSIESVELLVRALISADPECALVVCPPAVFLSQVSSLIAASIAKSRLQLGAQNLDFHDSGAFTGEISVPMLIDAGCDYAIVGHSERRELFAETDDVVAKKFEACVRHGLMPILCLGETLAQRNADETEEVVERQLTTVLELNGIRAFEKAVIAYEPIWAIGTGETATPEQAETVHQAIRRTLSDWDVNISENIQLLYGGSVNAENAAELFAKQNIDGALVGGASLKADVFLSICATAQKFDVN